MQFEEGEFDRFGYCRDNRGCGTSSLGSRLGRKRARGDRFRGRRGRVRRLHVDRSSGHHGDGRHLRGSAEHQWNGFCFYASSTDSLSIHVEDVSDLHTFDAELAAAKESQQTDKTPTTIPGLGDKAAGVGQQLVVAAGGKTIDIRDADTGGTAWPKSIALAKLVIAALH